MNTVVAEAMPFLEEITIYIRCFDLFRPDDVRQFDKILNRQFKFDSSRQEPSSGQC